MKKIYLFLLVTVLAFGSALKPAHAGGCPTTFDSFTVFDAIPGFNGAVILSYSPVGDSFTGDLFYEGSFYASYPFSGGFGEMFDLPPGNYEFQWCGQTTFFTINSACDLSILSIAATNLSAAGCTANGVIDVTVGTSSPGQTFYYILTDLINSTQIDGQDDGFGIINIPNLPASSYAITISPDADVLNSSCFVIETIDVTEPACDMDFTASSATNTSTQNGTDGSISVTVTGSSCIPSPPGGVPNYVVYATLNGSNVGSLVYNSGNGAYELSGLAAGLYTVIAENGGTTCFNSVELTVEDPSGCNLTAPVAVGLNTTICNGNPAILSVPDIYTSYQWLYEGSILIPTGFAGTDYNYWAYLEGNYSVVVTDINGCTATSNSIFVSAPLSPQINFPETFYSCDNSITITAPAGFDTYLWSTNETTPSITITTDGWYGLGAGVASLVCGVVDTFYVSLNNTAPIADITVIGNNPFCAGTSITLESASVDNNSWSTGETSQSISVNTTGVYTLEVSNSLGCTASTSVSVTSENCVPSTQLASGVCGNLGYVRTSVITCVSVVSATQYQWEFSNGGGVYATKLTPVNYLPLHGVSPILNWGTTWSVRVRAYIGANAGEYSAPCTIGIIQDPAIGGVPLTQLRTVDCGKLNYRINANNRIITNPVSGAIQYEFEFTDVTNGNVVATVLRPNTVLYFNQMNPILPFPAQYNVRTRARIGSTWGNFGPTCLIGIIGLNREEAPVAEELQYDADGNLITIAPYFDLMAMPNPYENITSIVINSSLNENVYIQFYDMTGKLVEDIKVATNERFNVGANFSKGIYLLKARSESGNEVTTRIIKTN